MTLLEYSIAGVISRRYRADPKLRISDIRKALKKIDRVLLTDVLDVGRKAKRVEH
jgi:hypothetical protein